MSGMARLFETIMQCDRISQQELGFLFG